MRTKVVIIGGGPSGLLLSRLLSLENIDNVVLEKQSREHVQGRIRAGVLENGTIEMLRLAGVSKRLDNEGFKHNGIELSFKNHGFRIDLKKLTDKHVTVYGQTEVTKDLYEIIEKENGNIINCAEDVLPQKIGEINSFVTFKKNGIENKIMCDFIVGCDGYHGISRKVIPENLINIFERVYPFGWLGILSETPPVKEELIYANHGNGFALASMRNNNLSRYYIQTSLDDRVECWDDKRFWEELKRRLPIEASESIITGPSIEKSIAPLRSFVCEPMNWNNLFLVGDAAHIVPPTGAKGLNLAVSDVYYLFNGNTGDAGIWPTLFGSCGALVTTFLVIPIVTYMSKKVGKKNAFLISQSISVIGYIMFWFSFVPGKPYMFLFALPFFSFGIGGLFTLMMSMTADVIDLDELQTGKRREGVFGAIYWWMVKFGFAIAGGLTGTILTLVGFTSGAVSQPESAITGLRLFFTGFPILGTLVAIYVMWDYDITEDKSNEISEELSKRKAAC